MDEAGKKGDDLLAGEGRTAHNLVQCLSPLNGIEQLVDGVVIGHHDSFGFLRLSPKCKMYRRSHDILVIDADISKHLSILVQSADGAFVGWWNCGNDDGASISVNRVEFDA